MIVLRWASLGAKFARLVSSRRWNKSPKDISFKGGEKCQCLFYTVAKMRFRPRIAEIQEMAICPSVGEKKR